MKRRVDAGVVRRGCRGDPTRQAGLAWNARRIPRWKGSDGVDDLAICPALYDFAFVKGQEEFPCRDVPQQLEQSDGQAQDIISHSRLTLTPRASSLPCRLSPWTISLVTNQARIFSSLALRSLMRFDEVLASRFVGFISIMSFPAFQSTTFSW